MKNIKINLLIASLLVFLSLGINSCKEVGPQLPWGHSSVLSDTTYVEAPAQAAETKNVLIEELTGVSCVNCPAGHDIVKGILTSSDRVFAVAIHGSVEPAALDGSIPGLTTQVLHNAESESLIESFGEPGSRPRGAIDRVIHTDFGAPLIWTDRDNWNPYTQTQLQQANSIVNIDLTNTYDSTTRTIAARVELHYTATQPDSSQALSIFLTEDSIVTAQLNGSNIDTFYVHNGVFRKALTNVTGDLLKVALAPGRVVIRTYSYKVTDPLWKPEHMNVVAFVNKNGNPNSEVLQVKRKPVK